MSKVVAVLKVLLAEVTAEDATDKDPIYGGVWFNPAFTEEQRNQIFDVADQHLTEFDPGESDWMAVKVHVPKPDDRSIDCELDVGDLIIIREDGTAAVLIGMELTPEQCAAAFA